MGAIREIEATQKGITLKPPTPEQRAKQAERLAQIGLAGEIYVLEQEKNKLQRLNLQIKGYPQHVALESTQYGYDVLSLDESGSEIYIEVKTTTRKKEDPNSRKFYISNYEIETFENNQTTYKLYRVYDIENSPSFEELDLAALDKKTDGYIIEY